MAPKTPRKRLAWSIYETDLPTIYARVRRGDFPPPDLLAQVLEEHKGEVLPAWLVAVVCAQLRGTLKRKRGPKPPEEWESILVQIADWDYHRHLAWLKRRKKKQGLKGWSCVRGKDWWQGPPHERALAIVYELQCREHSEFRHMGFRTFRNRLSSRR